MAHLRFLASTLLALATISCATMAPDELGADSKTDSPYDVADLVEETAPAIGLLRFVNDTNTTVALLKDEVDLRSDAANNLVEHRNGSAGTPNPFDDIKELDDVPRVGPATLQDLLDYAYDNGFVPRGHELLGTYDGVTFTVNEAMAVVSLVNDAGDSELDDDIALDGRAVGSILDARPLGSVHALSELSYVGRSALEKLKDYSSVGMEREIGILSDLDKTIVPPAPSGQDLPDDAYPGIAELLNILEYGNGSGASGDINFVTARQPNNVIEIPTWLSDHGVPLGPISTGISGIPWVAKDEKVRDISEVFEANPRQQFVMFGDSSHVDPDAYRIILEKFDGQVDVAFIHNVKNIDPARVEGLVLIDNYAEAAAELYRLEQISEDQARMVMQAVVAGGEIDAQTLEELITANRP